jgi:HPt (histidine-containing phosphotransfer) domain-containing protein
MTPHDKIVVHVDVELAELIPGFLGNQQKALATMQEALRQQDFATIKKVGHGMKGSGGGYGFDAVTDLGSAIEEAAKVSNDTEIVTCLASLADYLARVEVVYE